MRALQSIGGVAALLLALLPAASYAVGSRAVDPATCPPITQLEFSDPLANLGVEYDAVGKTLTFHTADGRSLLGTKARRMGKRKVTIVSSSPSLTVMLRADLNRGSAIATAIERDVDPNQPDVQGTGRFFHRLFVASSRRQVDTCRAVAVATLRPSATPTVRRTPTPARTSTTTSGTATVTNGAATATRTPTVPAG